MFESLQHKPSLIAQGNYESITPFVLHNDCVHWYGDFEVFHHPRLPNRSRVMLQVNDLEPVNVPCLQITEY